MNLYIKQKQTHRRRKQTYGYQRGKWRRDKVGVWDQHKHTTIYKIDNQQGPTVQYKKLYSIFCNYMGKESEKQWIHMCEYIYM